MRVSSELLKYYGLPHGQEQNTKGTTEAKRMLSYGKPLQAQLSCVTNYDAQPEYGYLKKLVYVVKCGAATLFLLNLILTFKTALYERI